MAQKKTLFETLQEKEELQEQLHILQEQHTLEDSQWIRFGIIFTVIALLTVFFPMRTSIHLNDNLNFKAVLGMVWTAEPVRAEFNFPIYKSSAVYKNDIDIARKNEPLVFLYVPYVEKEALNKLQYLLTFKKDSSRFSQALPVTESKFSEILAVLPQTDAQKKAFASQFEVMLTTIFSKGIINIPVQTLTTDFVSIRTSSVNEKVIPVSTILDSTKYQVFVDKLINSTISDTFRLAAQRLSQLFIKPNLQYSVSLTEQAKLAAVESVPKTIGIVRQGEMVVDRGEVVDEKITQKLQSYDNIRLFDQQQVFNGFMLIGAFILSATIVLTMVVYMNINMKKYYRSNYHLAGFLAPLVLVAFLVWITSIIETDLPLQFAILVPAFSMLFAILYETKVAFLITVGMALVVAGIRGGDYAVALAYLSAGTIASYSVGQIQDRAQILKSLLYTFVGFGLPILGISFARSVEFNEVLMSCFIAFLNSAISPIIAFGLLIVVERVFNVVSELRLLEYQQMNHPLLQELREKAPGTYQHTITIANLVENATREIGGRPLLAKVGAFFHDIGKLAKAEYFSENQLNIENKHDRLAPKKSAMIIRNHVEDGIELAKEYRLPQAIIDFIPQHHGTMLIKHFYAVAAEKAGSVDNVDERDFRYAGPKPQSKEAAILMIADSVEAISRTPIANDRESLRKAINGIIQERMSDGQFDECDLTFKDLQIITEVFVKNLVASSHSRVAYKQMPTKSTTTSTVKK
jgi:putative nucleotidyltransferase with HDIG domain